MSRWLDQTMVRGPRIALATTEKQFRSLLRDMKVPPDSVPFDLEPHVGAQVRFFRDGETGPPDTAIVLIPRGLKTHEAAARLAHEAVHIWQAWCERAGEVRESRVTEVEAYAIENLTRTLLKAYRHDR